MTDTTTNLATAPSGRRAALTLFTAMLTVFTCPCHIPILIFLLSGTAAGAFLQHSPALAALVLLPIFILSGTATWRLLSSKEDSKQPPQGVNEIAAPAARYQS